MGNTNTPAEGEKNGGFCLEGIRRITVAGAGTMGHSMAQRFAQYGYEVTLWNHRQPTLDRAREAIAQDTQNLVGQGDLAAADRDALLARIAYTTEASAFADCDLLVENIVENLDAKLAFYREASPLVPASAIVATNTSGLSINKLATAVKDPSRFLGMHWFNPPALIPLIEIIRNDATRDDVAQAVFDLSLAIGKKPALVQRDVPGFAANRIQLAVLREACDLVSRGVISVDGIDAVMKYGLGFRWAVLGPLETVDFGGLDTFDHIAEYLVPDLCDSHDVPALLHRHYEAGELGVKTGRGFHDYSGDKVALATSERDRKLLAVYHALYGEKDGASE